LESRFSAKDSERFYDLFGLTHKMAKDSGEIGPRQLFNTSLALIDADVTVRSKSGKYAGSA